MKYKPKAPILYGSDVDGEFEQTLPTCWAICDTCQGHGTDRGASVECDGGGFTSSEWAEQDEDFKQDYLAGNFDRPCGTCGGPGKVLVADRSQTTPEQNKQYDAQLKDDADYESLCAAERRMGA